MSKLLRAYTILEVILIILLIAVWTGVTLPRFGGGHFLNKYHLKTTVYNLASDMRSARNSAITNARPYIVNFDFTKTPQEYQIYQWSIASGNEVGEKKIIPSGVGGSGTNQYTFSLLGDAGSGQTQTIFSSAGAGQWTIIVIGPTGTVRIQKP
jgi:Tfp pilus assembly protein FimT